MDPNVYDDDPVLDDDGEDEGAPGSSRPSLARAPRKLTSGVDAPRDNVTGDEGLDHPFDEETFERALEIAPKNGYSSRLRPHEIAEVLARYKSCRKRGLSVMRSCELTAKHLNLKVNTVYHLSRKFRPTTDIAEDYIKSNALKLAMRVVRKANVDQSIDILSRPNIGVLSQPKTGGEGGGFMLSVSADSLGGVKVGVAQGASHAIARSPLPLQEGDGHTLGLQQGERGGRSQEHENGGDAHPGRVREGREADDEVLDAETTEPAGSPEHPQHEAVSGHDERPQERPHLGRGKIYTRHVEEIRRKLEAKRKKNEAARNRMRKFRAKAKPLT